MSATHTHLTQRHHSLLGSRAELERVREDLAKMRQVLAELPARIASAEEYEGVLTRHVELERDLLREESSRTGWEPPQQQPAPSAPPVPPALIGDRLERERSGSWPITQPVTPPPGVLVAPIDPDATQVIPAQDGGEQA